MIALKVEDVKTFTSKLFLKEDFDSFLIRTVICTSIGCGVTGAISFTLGVGSAVPSGGVFVIPAMTNPFAALLALLAGTCVTAVLLVLIKKKRTDADEVQVEEVEEEMDLSGITFS